MANEIKPQQIRIIEPEIALRNIVSIKLNFTIYRNLCKSTSVFPSKNKDT